MMYHVVNLRSGNSFWSPVEDWDGTMMRAMFEHRYSVCLVEEPISRPLAIVRSVAAMKRWGYIALAFCLLGCGSRPLDGEQHIWSGTGEKPSLDHVSVVSLDAEMLPLVQYGAEWWSETDELPIVITDSCDKETELCVDTAWVDPSTTLNGDIGGEAIPPAIGRMGHLRVSREVLMVKGMPDTLPAVVVSHELGHALGRGHVADSTELMNPTRDWKPTEICIDGEHCRPYGTL